MRWGLCVFGGINGKTARADRRTGTARAAQRQPRVALRPARHQLARFRCAPQLATLAASTCCLLVAGRRNSSLGPSVTQAAPAVPSPPLRSSAGRTRLRRLHGPAPFALPCTRADRRPARRVRWRGRLRITDVATRRATAHSAGDHRGKQQWPASRGERGAADRGPPTGKHVQPHGHGRHHVG